uniref:AAA+ ATPase domain-containing protein n=1 Tax=Chrysotila carterae TaxID=13221 RepID=A0A7S4FCJ1_CHRCT
MVLWVDKYRPKTLESMDYHTDLSAQLQRLISVGADLPHMLVYGPSGAGKKTRVMALLREMHGASVERVRVESRTFKVGSTSVELTLLSSAHHIELNPSDAGNRDREVVQEVIKEIAQTAPVLVSASEDGVAAVRGFKVVILNEVERLSKPAQHALRRTMEKHVGTCRLLLLCTNPCKVIAPIRSRCMCVRVSAPTHQEVARVLAGVASKEGFKLPEALALRISKASERNLRRAVLTLEACKVAQSPLSESQPIQLPDWQLFIGAIAEEVVKEQSPKQLLKVRGKLYELLSNCIPAETVMHYLVQSLLRRVPLAVRHETLHHAAIYEHRLQTGQKAIFHLEAFIARFMAVYKKHQLAGAR